MVVADDARHVAAAKLCMKLGKHAEALHHAESAVSIERDCLGTDHKSFQQTSAILQELKG